MTALATLRLLIADVDPTRELLTDEQLMTFFALHGVGNPTVEEGASWQVRRAAADALDAIATSEALVGKVITTQDLQTDGVKVAAELRAQATNHRALATLEKNDEDDAAGWMGVVEFYPNAYPAREGVEH